MKAGPDCLILLHHYEGCKLVAYPDPATGGKPWTIGWGTTAPWVKPGTKITQSEADQLLVDHLAQEFEPQVSAMVAPGTTQKQFDALCDFAYNAGPMNLRKSTLLQLHNAGNAIAAANQFPRWNLAAGKVMKGLQRRRAAQRGVYMGVDAVHAIEDAERVFP